MHRGLHGLAQMGGHDYITARSEKFLDDALHKLIPLVGEDEAMQTLCVIYVDADNQQAAEEVSQSHQSHQSRQSRQPPPERQ